MKKVLIYLAIILFIIGCKTQKKILSTTLTKETTKTEVVSTIKKIIDTTLTTKDDVKIIQIDFFPDTVMAADHSMIIDEVKYQGKIKTATITTISKAKEAKGVTKTDATSVTKIDKKVDDSVKVKTIPVNVTRWGWILGILLLLSAAGYWIYTRFFRK
jgi:hypothetical protein